MGTDRKRPLAAFVVVAVIAAILLVTSVRSQAAPGWLTRRLPASVVAIVPIPGHVGLWGAVGDGMGEAVRHSATLAHAATTDAPATTEAAPPPVTVVVRHSSPVGAASTRRPRTRPRTPPPTRAGTATTPRCPARRHPPVQPVAGTGREHAARRPDRHSDGRPDAATRRTRPLPDGSRRLHDHQGWHHRWHSGRGHTAGSGTARQRATAGARAGGHGWRSRLEPRLEPRRGPRLGRSPGRRPPRGVTQRHRRWPGPRRPRLSRLRPPRRA